jgi:hypothetical protein
VLELQILDASRALCLLVRVALMSLVEFLNLSIQLSSRVRILESKALVVRFNQLAAHFILSGLNRSRF